MAMIRKRGNRWQAVVKLGRDGAYGVKRKTFDKKGEASAWAIKTEAELREVGPTVEPDRRANRRTLGAYLWEALDRKAQERGVAVERNNYSEATDYEFHQWYLDTERMAGHALIAVRIGEITAEDLRQYLLDRMNNDGAASSTLRRHDWNMIRAAYRVAWSKGATADAVGDFQRHYGLGRTIGPQNNQRDRRVPLSVEARLIEATRRPHYLHYEWLITLSLETALRQGELLALEWRDIDLEHRAIHVPEVAAKTNQVRTIRLSRDAVDALKHLREIAAPDARLVAGVGKEALRSAWRRIKARALATARLEATEYATKGSRADPRAKRAAEDIPILEAVRWHDFRHEAITRWLDVGMPVHTAAAMSGHQTATVFSKYTHGAADDTALKYLGW